MTPYAAVFEMPSLHLPPLTRPGLLVAPNAGLQRGSVHTWLEGEGRRVSPDMLRSKIWIWGPPAVLFLTLFSDLNMANRHCIFPEV